MVHSSLGRAHGGTDDTFGTDSVIPESTPPGANTPHCVGNLIPKHSYFKWHQIIIIRLNSSEAYLYSGNFRCGILFVYFTSNSGGWPTMAMKLYSILLYKKQNLLVNFEIPTRAGSRLKDLKTPCSIGTCKPKVPQQ